MKLLRQETFINENRVKVLARTPVDGTDPAIVLGPTEFYCDFNVPVQVDNGNGTGQIVPVTVPTRLAGTNLAEAFADVPTAMEIAKGRAAEMVEAHMKKQAEASAKPSLVLPGVNGHTPASRLRHLSGE